jgi:hypothetical protein
MTDTQFVDEMTPDELTALLKGGKRSKWGNRWVEIDGLKFQSALEARHYQALKLREQAGQIRKLRLQVPVELQPSFRYWDEEKRKMVTIRAISLRIDFVYEEQGACPEAWLKIYDDAKGAVTPDYAIKWKMLQYRLRDEPKTKCRLTYKA